MHKAKTVYCPSSEMLLNYAMGNLAEAESLIVSGHVAYCGQCKSQVLKYENMGGFYLKNHEELEVSKDLWAKLEKKVSNLEQDCCNTNYIDYKLKSTLLDEEIRIPSFLRSYLENKMDTKSWKSTINNVRYANLEFKDKSFTGKILEIPPGKSMPKHGHEGDEATLVLHGGYMDEVGDYHKGDLVFASDNHVHSPVSSKETGCICVVVYSGSIRFKGILGTFLNFSKF